MRLWLLVNKFIKPIFEKLKGPKMLVIIGIIGIILIGLSSFIPTESDKKEISVSSFDVEEYRNELQKEYAALIRYGFSGDDIRKAYKILKAEENI